MFQLENLETIRSKYEGRSRGKTLIDLLSVHHNLVPVNYPDPDPELLGQFHERDARFEKLLAEAVLNEHSPLKLS